MLLRTLALAVLGATPAVLFADPLPQVSPNAGPDQAVLYPATAQLTGALNNRSPLDWWTADGNNATENKIVMYSSITGVSSSPTLMTTSGVVFGWPSDLIWINGQLYGIESFFRYLYTVVPATGICTPIGPANTYQDVYTLAYDVAGDRLFGVDLKKKKLLRFNRTTGAVTNIGGSSLVGYPLIRSLAYNDAQQVLYANDQQSDKLIRIDPNTGAVTYVATMPAEPFGRIEELTFFQGELYASDGLLNAAGDLVAGQLQHVDIVTGATYNIGPVLEDCSPHSLIVNSLPEDFLWTKVSGPGTANFSDPHTLSPTVTFSAPGTYELALTAFAYPTPIVDMVVITTLIDSDGDGIPDANDNCPAIANPGQQDCDSNGIGDVCEIASGQQQDCNLNGIPDNCEPDCNENGIPDTCDLAAGTSSDCNANGIPDSCDIASGVSQDCNANGIPDTCDLSAGTSLDCNANGKPDSCDIASGLSLDCDRNGVPDECELDCNGNGVPDACDLSTGASLDCNHNGRPDSCDIAAGSSHDCDSNAIPDECEVDCNGNGIPDVCDLSSGTSLDCNANGIPDSCDIASGSSSDCNANGIPDTCDIASGAGQDCNANGVLDACEIATGTALDCNGNGRPDSCDIASGTEADCNANGIPDSCDISSGLSQDCNANGIPDSCEIAAGTALDCNANGIPDSCDITSGVSLDCNANGVPDSCDLALGTSLDANINSVPDECEATNGFAYCTGNGNATPCPCGNVGGPDAGCANSTGFGARIYNSGGVSCSADDAALVGIHLPANKLALFITGDQTLNAGQGVTFFDGLLCLTVRRRYTPSVSSPTGIVSLSTPVAGSVGLIQPGQTWYFQAWYRSGLVGAPCGTVANTSNGLGIAFGP